MVKITQRSLNAGILSEGMYARSDTEKFQHGLRDAHNVVIRAQGGVENRSGFEAVTKHDTSDAENQWLVPFQFSTEQTYQLEFATGVFRVITDGAYVLDTAIGELSLDALSTSATAELTLTTAGDSAALAVGDLLYVSDPAGDHKLHDNTVKITSISGATIGFTACDKQPLDTTVGDWGTFGVGANVQKVYSQTHTLDDFPALNVTQDADTMYIAHEGHPPSKVGRLANDEWTFEDVAFGAKVTPVSDGSVSITRVRGPDVDLGYLETYEYAVSAISDDTFDESTPTATVSTTNDLYYQGSKNTISWAAVAGATRYAVYRKSAGALSYVGTTSDTTFTDENITPDTSRGPQLARNPFSAAGDYPSVVSFYEQRLVYGATQNDPQLVEMSRVSNLECFNAAYPSLPDDAFRFRIRNNRVNRVRGFVPSSSFVLLTSGGEWEIAAQGDGEYVRPDKRRLAPFSNYGASALPPLFTGTVALYVEPSGNVVREYRPNDGSTQPQDLTVVAADLFENRRIVSWAYAAAPSKLTWVVLDDGTLLTMTYMPEHDVWGWTRHTVGGDDAKVLQVSVVREDARDVAYIVVSRTINGQTVTTTERQRNREDLDVTDAYYVDGGVRIDSDVPVDEVSGLLHLRGQTLVGLLDGDVVEDLVVDTTGTVDISDRPAQKISLGITYESLIRTLDVSMDIEGLGSADGRYKSASEVAIKMKRSRGVEAGVSLDRMSELKEWDTSMIGGPIPLKTHTPNISVGGDWERDATMYVRQRNPLPLTVLSITPDWELGE